MQCSTWPSMTNFDTTLKIYDINLKFRKFRTLIKLLLLFEIRGSWRALTVGIAILLGCNKSENARVSEFPYQNFYVFIILLQGFNARDNNTRILFRRGPQVSVSYTLLRIQTLYHRVQLIK